MVPHTQPVEPSSTPTPTWVITVQVSCRNEGVLLQTLYSSNSVYHLTLNSKLDHSPKPISQLIFDITIFLWVVI